MGLVFTDDQIKNISKDIILIPTLINDPENGMIAQKAKLLLSKDSLLKTDNDQKVFSDFWIDTLTKYHSELLKLNGVQRTNYDANNILLAGDQVAPHFPSSPIWTKLPPKLIDSMNGLPITTTTNRKELDVLSELLEAITILKTGFNDGSIECNVINVTSSTLEVDTGGTAPSVGQRFIVDSGGLSFIGKVTGVTVPAPPEPPVGGGPAPTPANTSINFTLMGGVNLSSGRLRTFHSGFSNAERSGLGTPNYANSVMLYLETRVNDRVTEWKTFLNDIKAIVESNGDLPPRKTHNQQAIANIVAVLSSITPWESMTVISSNGKYTDSGLNIIETQHTTRQGQVNARVTEIATDLGTVTQDASTAEFSGSGVYLALASVLGLRVSKASGTMFQYKQADMGVALFDKKISDANKQLDQYNQVMLVVKTTEDIEIGQIDLPVESTTGLSVGDSLKLLDNESTVYQRTINAILPSGKVRLSSGLPAQLQKGNIARIVKLK